MPVPVSVVLIASIFSWKSSVIVFQPVWQVVLSLLVAIYTVILVLHRCRQPALRLANINDSGNWKWLQPQSSEDWRLSCQSRVGWGFLWIKLINVKNRSSTNEHWVLSNQLEQRQYRRLSRIILRVQKQQEFK